MAMDPKAQQMDNILLTFAQQCGGINEILHQFMAFLARRTDFYYIQVPKALCTYIFF